MRKQNNLAEVPGHKNRTDTTLVLLGAAVWGPWWGSEELAQAQDAARGALDSPGEASDEDERYR